MKLIKDNFILTVIVSLGLIVAIAILAWQNLQSFLAKALYDSANIRVSEQNACINVGTAEEPYFSGCNSIL